MGRKEIVETQPEPFVRAASIMTIPSPISILRFKQIKLKGTLKEFQKKRKRKTFKKFNEIKRY